MNLVVRMNIQDSVNDIQHYLPDFRHLQLWIFDNRLVPVILLTTYPVVQIEVTQFHIDVIPGLGETATLENGNDIFMFVEHAERDYRAHFIDDVHFLHIGRQSDEFSSKRLRSARKFRASIERNNFQLPFLFRYCGATHGYSRMMENGAGPRELHLPHQRR
jgi:hypothetical protein